ncbi:MAG: RHS repeat-associated core domain-containing protein [Terriglobia bacterium]
MYTASGLAYYRHPDWLGSSRFASTTSRTMYNDLAYAPFGEQYATAGTVGVANTSFAGNNEDTTTNLYDAQFREYEIYGRWPSPDPAGLAVVNPANPQSWNRYAYVGNMPLTFIDPLGLVPILEYEQDCSGDTSFAVPGGVGVNANCVDYILEYDDGTGYTTGGGGGGGGGGDGLIAPPPPPMLQNSPPQSPTPAQAATNYCQQHGQLSFNIPFTHIPVTIGFSATGFLNFSTTNDIGLTFPPSAGASLDITVGAPQGPNIPVQVGSGKNLSIGTFLTPSGPRGFSTSLGPSIGSPVTFSPQVANACGLKAGGG